MYGSIEENINFDKSDYEKAFSHLENTVSKLQETVHDNYLILIPYERFRPLDADLFFQGISSNIQKDNFELQGGPVIDNEEDLKLLQEPIEEIIESEGDKRFILFYRRELWGKIRREKGIRYIERYVSNENHIEDSESNYRVASRQLVSDLGQDLDREFFSDYIPDFQFYVIFSSLFDESLEKSDIDLFNNCNNRLYLEYEDFISINPELKKFYCSYLNADYKNWQLADRGDQGEDYYRLIHYRSLSDSIRHELEDKFGFSAFEHVSRADNDVLRYLQRLCIESRYLSDPYIQIGDILPTKEGQKEVRSLFEELTGESFSMTDNSANAEIIQKHYVELFSKSPEEQVLESGIKNAILEKRFEYEVNDRVLPGHTSPEKILGKINDLVTDGEILSSICHNYEDILSEYWTEESLQDLKSLVKRSLDEGKTAEVEKLKELGKTLNKQYITDLVEESRQERDVEEFENKILEFNPSKKEIIPFASTWVAEAIGDEKSPVQESLSEKYSEFTGWLVDNYKQLDLVKSNNLVQDLEKESGPDVVLVVDGFGLTDSVTLQNRSVFEHEIDKNEPALAVLPTATPCAMPALATGYSPGELGIFSQHAVKNGEQINMFDGEKNSLNDAFDEVPARNNIQFILPSGLEDSLITHTIESCAQVRKSTFSKEKLPKKYRKNIANELRSSLNTYARGYGSGTIIIYLSDFEDIIHNMPDTLVSDKFWDIQAEFLNKLIDEFKKTVDSISVLDEEVTLTVTGDHGKLSLPELKFLSDFIDTDIPSKTTMREEFSGHRKSNVNYSTTGKVYAEWIEDMNPVSNKISEWKSLNGSDVFLEEDGFWQESKTGLEHPNFVFLSRYDYGGNRPDFSAHGGTSFSEILIPKLQLSLPTGGEEK
ncbi:MAG: alkaline phosphatase family protein [Candidatus Nanohaloarchaea archaeon]